MYWITTREMNASINGIRKEGSIAILSVINKRYVGILMIKAIREVMALITKETSTITVSKKLPRISSIPYTYLFVDIPITVRARPMIKPNVIIYLTIILDS